MEILTHVPLAPFSTFRIGGVARYFVRVDTVADLVEAFRFARERSLPVFILGGGSNVLIADEEFKGLVIKIELRGVSFEPEGTEVTASVAAGEPWDAFVAETVERGLQGLENLSGIPGSVGAVPVQNVGAYGVEVAQTIVRVEVFNPATETVALFSNAECDFGYRDSFFKTEAGRSLIITRVYFRLNPRGVVNTRYRDVQSYFARRGIECPTVKELRAAVIEIRQDKFPDLTRIGTAGSFFKNPIISAAEAAKLQEQFQGLPLFPLPDGRVKVALGWLLEQLGWKGKCVGAVGTFDRQSLVLINVGGATAREVREFAEAITQDVQEKTGMVIVPEIIFAGDK